MIFCSGLPTCHFLTTTFRADGTTKKNISSEKSNLRVKAKSADWTMQTLLDVDGLKEVLQTGCTGVEPYRGASQAWS